MKQRWRVVGVLFPYPSQKWSSLIQRKNRNKSFFFPLYLSLLQSILIDEVSASKLKHVLLEASVVTGIPFVIMALGIVFGIVFIVLVCRSRGVSEEVRSIWIWPCWLYICLYLIFFLLILPVQCLSAHKHFYMLFLFKMTFLGKGSFNRLRINAPKQRNGPNIRNVVRQVLSSVPNSLANSSKKTQQTACLEDPEG